MFLYVNYFDWYNRNTASNPLALQAKKTVALEVWEQLGRRLPDAVYLPVGDGVTLAAFVHGCEELIQCGVADRLPRVVGVQASGAAPLVHAFEAGHPTWDAVMTRTIADGIDVGDPYFGRQALEAVARTGGSWLAVSDDNLRGAIGTLAQTGGILAEPAGAAALAGVIVDQARLQASGETIVALVSGTGLKDQRWLPSGSGRAVEIAVSLEAVEQALRVA
jgi:threonine synthase